jgi:exopolyphosphatase/guanosine-5'-triphosphate,3'-diphosphate pyrophosphatase
VAHLQPSDEPRLVVDIGGRSTELILGQGRLPQVAESFAVGSVGLSMRFFSDGRFTPEAFRAAQVAAGAEFEEGLQAFGRERWQHALGSSGTAGAVAQVLRESGRSDGRITPDGLRWFIERCLEAGHVDRLQLPGLKPDRRPVIAGGLSILYTLATQFGIDALLPAKGALRQGVIVDLHQRRLAQRKASVGDLRDASVLDLQRRFAIDTVQAERVAATALALFQQACPDADPVARRELRWACALHEMGLMVSHHDHHRHSAYLMGHVDAPGFSQSQQRRLAELVLGQRGGLRKIEQALLRPGFAWQVLCLRLAVIACHARMAVSPHDLQLRAEGALARLGWKRGWPEQHQRTVYLLQEEVQAWQRHGPLRLLLPD